MLSPKQIAEGLLEWRVSKRYESSYRSSRMQSVHRGLYRELYTAFIDHGLYDYAFMVVLSVVMIEAPPPRNEELLQKMYNAFGLVASFLLPQVAFPNLFSFLLTDTREIYAMFVMLNFALDCRMKKREFFDKRIVDSYNDIRDDDDWERSDVSELNGSLNGGIRSIDDYVKSHGRQVLLQILPQAWRGKLPDEAKNNDDLLVCYLKYIQVTHISIVHDVSADRRGKVFLTFLMSDDEHNVNTEHIINDNSRVFHFSSDMRPNFYPFYNFFKEKTPNIQTNRDLFDCAFNHIQEQYPDIDDNGSYTLIKEHIMTSDGESSPFEIDPPSKSNLILTNIGAEIQSMPQPTYLSTTMKIVKRPSVQQAQQPQTSGNPLNMAFETLSERERVDQALSISTTTSQRRVSNLDLARHPGGRPVRVLPLQVHEREQAHPRTSG